MKVKSEQEIQETASQWLKDNNEETKRFSKLDYQDGMFYGYQQGYKQCQQDYAALIECLQQKITMMQRVFDGIAAFTKRR